MPNYTWPVSMLEEYKLPVETMLFFQGWANGAEDRAKEFEELYDEHQLLKCRAAKMERYIPELEKQIDLLQKTLDLVDKNKPRFIIKPSSNDIVDLNRGPVILHKEADSIIPIYPERWIPVTERLPEKYTTVLIYDGDSVEPSEFLGEHGFWTVDDYEAHSICGVTHWMPLPEPPKGD